MPTSEHVVVNSFVDLCHDHNPTQDILPNMSVLSHRAEKFYTIIEEFTQ